MIYRAQTAPTQGGQGTEELSTQKYYPNSTKARESNFNVADVQCDAEPLKKDQEGTMAIMMQGGSHHLGKESLIAITSENVIKRKIFGHERDPMITSPGLIVEDVIPLL